MNTSPGIFASANAAIEKLGLPPEHDVNQLSKFIGPPITQCFVKVYNLEPSLIDEAISLYRVEYDTHGRFNAHPYTGIPPQLLSTLKKRGYLLAIGTLKYELLAKQMMEHFNLDGYFDSIRGGADLDSTLSKADIVNKVLNDLSVEAKDAVLIGDTYHDQTGAMEANVPFIAVDWGGFGFPKGHQKDDTTFAVVRTPEELLSLV